MAKERSTKEGNRKGVAGGTTTPKNGTRKERVSAQQDCTIIDDEKRRRARQRIYDAYLWIQTYPRAFQFVNDYLRNEYEQGHRLSMQMAWERLREKERSGTKGEAFALNNDLRPVLSRILLLENPQYRNKMELRRSPLDSLMGIRR
jgi:hypothetical protein